MADTGTYKHAVYVLTLIDYFNQKNYATEFGDPVCT